MELKMRSIFDKSDRNYLILSDYEKYKTTYNTSVYCNKLKTFIQNTQARFPLCFFLFLVVALREEKVSNLVTFLYQLHYKKSTKI